MRRIADECKYPIRDGCIFLLDKPEWRFNDKANCFLSHWHVIWILRVFKKIGEKRRQDRFVRVFRLMVPKRPDASKHALPIEKRVRLRSLTKQLAGGYELIDDHCLWYDHERDACSFYNKVQNYLKVVITGTDNRNKSAEEQNAIK